MSQPLTRVELNILASNGCQYDECTAFKGAGLGTGQAHFKPTCHPKRGLVATYQRHLGTLKLACALCGSVVAEVSVTEC